MSFLVTGIVIEVFLGTGAIWPLSGEQSATVAAGLHLFRWAGENTPFLVWSKLDVSVREALLSCSTASEWSAFLSTVT